MSDQDDINLEGGDSAAGEAPAKKGGGLLPQLLKWVAIVLGALVFIVTVVIITVSVLNKGGASKTSVPISDEYVGQREVLNWYSSAIGTIQTRTCDEVPASVVVDMSLGFTIDDKATQTELTSRIVELKDFLRSYFQKKTAAELRNEDKIKIELRNAINDNILSNSKIKDVRFTKYEIVEQQ